MTQQYLIGELSILIAQLQAAGDAACSAAAARLRTEAETLPVTHLRGAVLRALELTDAACWDSLGRGDGAAFTRLAEIGVQLRDFAASAGLLTQA
jgi:hypothetical protein